MVLVPRATGIATVQELLDVAHIAMNWTGVILLWAYAALP